MKLSQALKEKRTYYYSRYDKVILLHDNACSHVAAPVNTYLGTLKWKVWPQPPYLPDIAPSDFQLFWLMTHGLPEQHLTSYENTKNWVDSWIASKDEAFFRCGIGMLPEKREKVVGSDGQYFEKNIMFSSFTMNAQFSIKNGGNLFVHLIINLYRYLIYWCDEIWSKHFNNIRNGYFIKISLRNR